MSGITFTIPGRPQGYVRMTRAGRFCERARRYHEWCEKVRLCAAAAGIAVPLIATAARPVRLRARVLLGRTDFGAYETGRLPDMDNVAKGLADALCYISKDARALRRLADPKWRYYADKFVDAHCALPSRAGGLCETVTEVEVATI